MAPRLADLFLVSEGEPRGSLLLLSQSPLQVGGSPLLIGRIGHAEIFTSPHNALVPYTQAGRERKDGEMNRPDRAPLVVDL